MSKTDRDRYLVATFRFLLDHIVRQPTRVAHSVSITCNKIGIST